MKLEALAHRRGLELEDCQQQLELFRLLGHADPMRELDRWIQRESRGMRLIRRFRAYVLTTAKREIEGRVGR